MSNSVKETLTRTLSLDFANSIADEAFRAYKVLPKKGKPQLHKEWTLLAAVIMKSKIRHSEESSENNLTKDVLETVALGTGSKCIGKSKMSTRGDVLNDSHAEILARRAFLRFLYNELEKAYRNNSSKVFQSPTEDSNHLCSLNPGITFHFFTSHTPCGDASIFAKQMKDLEINSESKCSKVCHRDSPEDISDVLHTKIFRAEIKDSQSAFFQENYHTDSDLEKCTHILVGKCCNTTKFSNEEDVLNCQLKESDQDCFYHSNTKHKDIHCLSLQRSRKRKYEENQDDDCIGEI
ncbi:tRNA-specific adenosine deaminase 1, partial [Bulinus truncatus]